MLVQPLNDGHDRKGFDCGDADSLKSSTVRPGRFRILTGIELIPESKKPRHLMMRGVWLKITEQTDELACLF